MGDVAQEEVRIGWTQPLCPVCFAAWDLGRGNPPREPTRLVDDEAGEPCLICAALTTIFVRVDPALARLFPHPKAKT